MESAPKGAKQTKEGEKELDSERMSLVERFVSAYAALRRYSEKIKSAREKRWDEFADRRKKRKMAKEGKAAPIGQPLGQINPQELTNAPVLKAENVGNDKKEGPMKWAIPKLLGGWALIGLSKKSGPWWEEAKKDLKAPFSRAAFGDIWKKFFKAATKI